jgi:serine/threonine protein phosphatase 1
MNRTSGTKLRWEHLDAHRLRPHCSEKTLVVGHTPQVGGEILDLGFLVCIDTDCFRGEWLSALDVSTGLVVQANQRGELRGTGGSYPPMDRLRK